MGDKRPTLTKIGQRFRTTENVHQAIEGDPWTALCGFRGHDVLSRETADPVTCPFCIERARTEIAAQLEWDRKVMTSERHLSGSPEERAAVRLLLALARARVLSGLISTRVEDAVSRAIPVVAGLLEREDGADAGGGESFDPPVHVLVAASGTLYPHAFTDPRDADAATAVAEQRYGEVFGVRRLYLVVPPGR